MSESSARLGLPFILPGQAQKELFHNEALALIDAALHPAVENAGTAAPPAAPTEGQCWIVASGATGEWAEHEGAVACWTSGGWRFFQPMPGTLAWEKAAGHWIHWGGSQWSDGGFPASSILIGGVQVVGARQPAVPSPSGGTTIDQEARTVIATLIATLKTHGLIE